MAPTKFIAPAMPTAVRGDITRVDTTVAIAFAESLKPLTKSKARAIDITTTRNVKEVGSIIGPPSRLMLSIPEVTQP